MGLLKKFFGKRRFEEEEAVIKALESAETAKESDSDDSDIEDLEKLWLERRKGARVVEEKGAEEEGGPEEEEQEQEQEQEQKQEGEGGISEDELISSLKEVDKEEGEEMDLVIKEVMEEMGDVSAKEILELGREILNNMRGGRR